MTTAWIIHKNSASHVPLYTLYCNRCTKSIQPVSEVHLNNLIQQRKFCYLLRESQSIASSGVRNSLSSSPASFSLISILLWYFYFSHILHTVCFIVQQYSKAENNAVKCSLKSYLKRAVAEQLLVVVRKKKKRWYLCT